MNLVECHTQAAELVMRDLIDAAMQENLFAIAERAQRCPPLALVSESLRPDEEWWRLDLATGWLCFRVLPAAALQPYRFSRGPVWFGTADTAAPMPLEPADLLALLIEADSGEATLPGAERVVADLGTAVEHAAVTLAGRRALADDAPRPGGVLAGERLAATRNRPFHPTARAISGWSAAELSRYGPLAGRPFGVDWVAVRRDRLRLGGGPGSKRLHELLLDEAGQHQLAERMRWARLDMGEFQPLPVHPWQFEHVLSGEFANEFATGEVVAVTRALGEYYPTASLRTLATAPEGSVHVKLPLGVATLGATRLLPPRYLDNGDRAQQTMRDLVERDAELSRLVVVAEEHSWSGWQHPSGRDEFEDRPGHLAAQIRVYPPQMLTDPRRLVLPMAGLAAHEWDTLGEVFGRIRFGGARGRDGALDLFGELADAFCRMGLSFLRYGVLPELHGQNVLVVFLDGAVERFILRDHDALRLYPEWMALAGVPDPAYRITPGAPQSLYLPSPEALLGYLQTLGFQVNLYGIADALTRRYEMNEAVFWSRLRASVASALAELTLPEHVAELVHRVVLGSSTWPCRQLLGPMLRRVRSGGVSMPAALGQVPNPLLSFAGPPAAIPRAARS